VENDVILEDDGLLDATFEHLVQDMKMLHRARKVTHRESVAYVVRKPVYERVIYIEPFDPFDVRDPALFEVTDQNVLAIFEFGVMDDKMLHIKGYVLIL